MSATPPNSFDLTPASRRIPGVKNCWVYVSGEDDPSDPSLAEAVRRVCPPELRVATVSLESQQRFYENELRQDDTDYLDRLDTGTRGIEVLLQSGRSPTDCRQVAIELELGFLLERGYRLLSTGESRLLLLLKEVLSKPDLLIVENVFDGLAVEWRKIAEGLLAKALEEGTRMVVIGGNLPDWPQCTTHCAHVRVGHPLQPVPIEEAASMYQSSAAQRQPSAPPLPAAPSTAGPVADPLVRMRDCAVRYPEANGQVVTQFEHLNWTLRPGEHTLILGPNGAGKSTLLQMLSGDHSQSYGNDLKLFGFQRGSGESVWDIKKNIGLVSPALHRDYRARGNLLSVVVSGLYDSIGLYRQPSESDKRLALEWLGVLGMKDLASDRFDRLSWAQQRLVLIARGLIKHPPLLVLDEPTQGLDARGRQLLLEFLPKLARIERTTLLMVTHREEECLPLFSRKLKFEISGEPGVRFIVKAI